jgi:hydrogenase maturation protease
MPRYLIGVGNETMTDDGIGPRVADAVAEHARALGFDIVIIGHDTIGLLSYFDQTTSRLVFVDCVRMGRSPGEWLVFSPDDVVSQKRLDRMTTHEGDLLRIIDMARQLGTAVPPVTILGIEPASVEPGLELSPTLQQRFDEYVQAAVAEMQRAG